MLVQITAARGPAECALAVSHVLRILSEEAIQFDLALNVLELDDGTENGTLNSVLLSLDGDNVDTFLTEWIGSIQWTCQSPFRPRHKRKNWFVGVSAFDDSPQQSDSGEFRYESCRASGPGGQHVNKTDSAIRATHVASGISVKVQTERSQHANKRLAQAMIKAKLADQLHHIEVIARTERRNTGLQLERGNPVRVYKGPQFLRTR